jgi:hypothetical protein
MERDPFGGPEGGSDHGPDHVRDLGDAPPPAYRDSAPDYLAPIDPTAPVSGHQPAPVTSTSVADSPEHDWEHARDLVYPVLRPVGTSGQSVETLDLEALAASATKSHTQPLIDEGPAGLPVAYALHAGSFDVMVSGDHLLSWGVGTSEVQEAALRNLANWSSAAPWTDEVSGERRLISSETGDGRDAARILLPEVVEHLARELGQHGRVLVGLPERHVLVAAALREGDDEFAELFAEFVLEHSGGSDEPIDRRVFEIVDGRLVEFTGIQAT